MRAYGELAGPELPKLALRVDGKDVTVFNVGNEGNGVIYETRATSAEQGNQKISVAYLNNYVDLTNPDPKLRGDRNVFVEYVEIVRRRPASRRPLPESHKRLITRMPQPGQEHEVAMEILGAFLPRGVSPAGDDRRKSSAWRSSWISRRRTAAHFLEGIQTAFQAALCSPYFLFRWELDPATAKPGDTRELTDYEIASRLSYFLWSSKPDRELFALAAKGELRKPEVLEKQVARMLQGLAGAGAGRTISATSGCRFATSGTWTSTRRPSRNGRTT